MTEQEIINNAPCNDWTGITDEGIYTLVEGRRCHVWLGTCWSVPISNELDIFYDCPIRSRKDIERIAELEKQLERCEESYSRYIENVLEQSEWMKK